MLYCNLINLLDQRKLLVKVKINLIQKNYRTKVSWLTSMAHNLLERLVQLSSLKSPSTTTLLSNV